MSVTNSLYSVKVWVVVGLISVVLMMIFGILAASIAEDPFSGDYFWKNPFNGALIDTTIPHGLTILIIFWVFFFIFFLIYVFAGFFKVWQLACS
jgi:hypothetical protein